MAASSVGTCLIVGASRGIGLGLVQEQLKRGWRVIATVRDAAKATEIAASLKTHADMLRIELVDITIPDQVTALRGRLGDEKLDLLLVNAGITFRPSDTPLGEIPADIFSRIMLTNAYSPIKFADDFAALVKPQGMMAFMSSGLGSVANNVAGGREIYRASKAALNTLSRSLYARRKNDVQTMLTLHPGHVKTDMTAMNTAIDVETSVRGLCDVIGGARGQAGHRYVDYHGQTIPW